MKMMLNKMMFAYLRLGAFILVMMGETHYQNYQGLSFHTKLELYLSTTTTKRNEQCPRHKSGICETVD
jgi:hypothetical protein